jgi:hypothetical protein
MECAKKVIRNPITWRSAMILDIMTGQRAYVATSCCTCNKVGIYRCEFSGERR